MKFQYTLGNGSGNKYLVNILQINVSNFFFEILMLAALRSFLTDFDHSRPF